MFDRYYIEGYMNASFIGKNVTSCGHIHCEIVCNIIFLDIKAGADS